MRAPDSRATFGDYDVLTVEAINIHVGDLRLLVTYTDEHGNETAGHMEDLTLSESPVNSDNNAEPVPGTSSRRPVGPAEHTPFE
jgi:hypothetical protein